MLLWNLESSYLGLPDSLYSFVATDPAPGPSWAAFNTELARDLGMGSDPEREDLLILSGSAPPPGGTSYAQAYAGHQFGYFAMLGDGRAAVLGEAVDPSGARRDLQLKGSGPTPYARGGDGKAALGPMLREYLIGEYLHALGIPCTRALSVALTGESVRREAAKPGAVLCRVAASHLRVGTFQYAAAFAGPEALKALADYAAWRHYPSIRESDAPYVAFLDAVGLSQAKLVAAWMAAGFVHGVMNTDNVSIAGQAIDFGPCAFLDTFKSGQVFSSIDREGRYAWGRQPSVAAWNHARLAEALLPLLHEDEATALVLAEASLARFKKTMEGALIAAFSRKLGIAKPRVGDRALIHELLDWMERVGADFTSTFQAIGRHAAGQASSGPLPESAWLGRWSARIGAEADPLGLMAAANPLVHPRNRPVQAALDAAESGDLAPFNRLLSALKSPYDPESTLPELEPSAADAAAAFVTYCGT